MARIEKTIFLSYRRTNVPWALAISQGLTHNGYDVFLDFTGIAGGDFEAVILDNIHSRAHFLVLLTPSALERCGEPGDWLRREIEAALDSKRNIVPLMLEGFDFGTPSIANQLTGKLAALKKYNAMTVSAEYFDAAMDKLRNKFLNVALDTIVHPTSSVAAQAAADEKVAVASVPAVAEQELTAQHWFERGVNAADLDEEIRFNSEAIRLKPDFSEAFYNRGLARHTKGDLAGAIQDYTEAIRLNPADDNALTNRGNARSQAGDVAGAIADYTEAIRVQPSNPAPYNNRGTARASQGDIEGALADIEHALLLKPDYVDAFINRGNQRHAEGDVEGALADYSEAARLAPTNASAFFNRGFALYGKGDLDAALTDYDEAIRLNPGHASAFLNRGVIRQAKGDMEGALADFNEAIRLRPDNAAFNSRGAARAVRGDLEGALADFNEALRLKPDFPRAINNRDLVLKALAERSKS